MRRAMYALLLVATTSFWACDSRPISGAISGRSGGNGSPDAGSQVVVTPENVPPAGFEACTTDTWQTFASAQLVANCTRCHSEMSDFIQTEAQSAGIRTSLANGTMPSDRPMAANDVARVTRWIDCDLAP